MTIPLNELLEKAMKKCDSTMKETIEDYLFLRKEASDDFKKKQAHQARTTDRRRRRQGHWDRAQSV